jgi:hypothetical protein
MATATPIKIEGQITTTTPDGGKVTQPCTIEGVVIEVVGAPKPDQQPSK